MSVPSTGLTKVDDMLPLPSAWTYEAGLPTEAWIPGFWVGIVPVISGTGADTIYSFSSSVGQRDQYHSQGNAQAPSATQICQRG